MFCIPDASSDSVAQNSLESPKHHKKTNVIESPLSRQGVTVRQLLLGLSLNSGASSRGERDFTLLPTKPQNEAQSHHDHWPINPQFDTLVSPDTTQTTQLDVEALSRIYQFNFTSEPKNIPSTLFGTTELTPFLFGYLIELVLNIETQLIALEDQEMACSVRSYIIKYLQSSNYPNIFAELGSIYFYLDKYDPLPCKENFLLHRQQDIAKEIKFLLESQIPQLPTGVTAFLLRAFCNMAIDNQGRRNIGGIFAIFRLLNGSQIASHFKDNDYFININTFFTSFLTDQEFVTRLETPVTVHPSMEFFIRVDLKIAEGEPITPQHVRRACLIALLHELRQIHHPNCFAVAPVIYGKKAALVAILQKYQELLKEGTIQLPDVQIPVSLLLSTRMLEEGDLNILLTSNEFCSASSVQAALRSIGVDPSSLSGIMDKVLTLREFLWLASTKTTLPKYAFIKAACTVGSFKKNVLQEILVYTLEFLETNQTAADTDLTVEGSGVVSRPRGVKNSLIKFLNEGVIQQLHSTFPDFTSQPEVAEFMRIFESRLLSSFWFQNHSGKIMHQGFDIKVSLSNGSIISIPHFTGDFSKLQSSILNHRRLICVRDNKLTVIDTNQVLCKMMITIIDEIHAERTLFEESVPSETFMLFLKGFFKSSILPELLADFLLSANAKTIPLNKKHYLDSSLIVFSNDGGHPLDFPLKALGIVHTQKKVENKIPVHTFFDIFDYLHSLPNKNDFKSHQKPLLCSSLNHTFLLFPQQFSALWLQDTTYREAIHQHSRMPLTHLLQKSFTEEQMKRVLMSVFHDKTLSDNYFVQFQQATTGFRFKDLFLQSISSMYHFSCMCALEKELTRVASTQIPWEKILKDLPSPPIADQARAIKAQLEFKFSNFTFLHSHEIVFHFQNTLLAFGKFISKPLLERVVCTALNLPLGWTLGDLNYGDDKESPEHEVLILKLLPHQMTLFTRRGVRENPIADALYQGMQTIKFVHP